MHKLSKEYITIKNYASVWLSQWALLIQEVKAISNQVSTVYTWFFQKIFCTSKQETCDGSYREANKHFEGATEFWS